MTLLKPTEQPADEYAIPMTRAERIEEIERLANGGRANLSEHVALRWLLSELAAADRDRERMRPLPQTFWVIERFENGRSAGYWDGGSSRHFIRDIDNAVQFCRQQDAFPIVRRWHWKDVEITEHCYLARAALTEKP